MARIACILFGLVRSVEWLSKLFMTMPIIYLMTAKTRILIGKLDVTKVADIVWCDRVVFRFGWRVWDGLVLRDSDQ